MTIRWYMHFSAVPITKWFPLISIYRNSSTAGDLGGGAVVGSPGFQSTGWGRALMNLAIWFPKSLYGGVSLILLFKREQTEALNV